eukprot:CAMPEP_0174926416 /NCGR_PEP_ID=MMETSP1355-20121228/11237_1 /TAXON_ID=464990 /ORGANISM="Hemiselmis tepida, Strain CCMP443" /LENGTH=68 /DNA_ID=CAMNT_0016172443 /DNA_START=74 /DNA_END=277 /DNA_ORIENTATION=+
MSRPDTPVGAASAGSCTSCPVPVARLHAPPCVALTDRSRAFDTCTARLTAGAVMSSVSVTLSLATAPP